MIDQAGKTTTYQSFTTLKTYDTSTGSYTGGSSSNLTVKAYFHNYTLEEFDGQNIVKGDRKVLLKTTDTSGTTIPEPKISDTFNDNVSIKSVEKIYYGDTVICYMCQVSGP